MSSTRTFIANAEKIEEGLNKASKCKDCRESILILETLQADQNLREFLTQPSNQRDKLITAYNTLVHTFTTELYQLSQYLAGQLDELDNVKIDDNSPASHTNASTAFSNLSRYLVNDILSAPDAATRVLALKRWLKILDMSMNLGDFHSAAAIYAGLNDAALSRLQTTFMHLSADEKSLLDKVNDIFLRDQGWKLMGERLESSDRNYFIPSLAGIKKAMTKAKEARQTHSMHSEFLESQGKLTRSSTLSAASAANPDSVKPTKKSPLELLTELIAELKQSTRLSGAQELTGLQRDLILANTDQTNITVKPINQDEGVCYALASQIERDEIPGELKNLQAELYKTLTFLLTQKKLPEPLKTIKKALRKFSLQSILSDRFGSSEECAELKTMLAEIVTQAKTPRTPRLLRANTKTKLAPTNDSLPDVKALSITVNQIADFTKRLERLMRESSASTSSVLTASSSISMGTASAASAAASISSDSQASLEYPSSSSSSQRSFGSDSDSALSMPSLMTSTTQLTQFSFRIVPPVKIDAADTTVASAPPKAIKSLHKVDAAGERGQLSRHGSMSMTPRKGSPNLSATPQGSPKRSPQGSPGTTKNKK